MVCSEAMSYQEAEASSQEQGEKIDKVRLLLGSGVVDDFLTESTIARFLRATNWSSEQAAKALADTLSWRRQYAPHSISLQDIADKDNQTRKTYVADYLDKHGRSVLVTNTAIKSKISGKEQIKYLVYLLEYLQAAGRESVVWLTDFRGWSISCTPLSTTRESIHIIQKHYPGLIHVAIAFDPPIIFESFWKIVRRCVQPHMKDKLKFVYANNPQSQKIISDMFDFDKMEQFCFDLEVQPSYLLLFK